MWRGELDSVVLICFENLLELEFIFAVVFVELFEFEHDSIK